MNSDEENSEEDEEVEWCTFDNRRDTLLDVKANGQCLHECLGVGVSSGNKSAAGVQIFIYRMTAKEEAEKNGVLDFVRTLDLKPSQVTSLNKAKENVKQWNIRLSVRLTGARPGGTG
jgi:hypothetical protein